MRVRVQEHWGVFSIKLALILFLGLMLSPARGDSGQAEACEKSLILNRKSTVERNWTGKTVILDTNVLLVNPSAVYDFPGARIVLPMMVLQEIDKKKKPDGPGQHSVASNARKAARLIENLTESSKPGERIRLRNGATFEIEARDLLRKNSSPEIREILDARIADDRIIATAVFFSKDNDAVFISQDVSAKNKARALGVNSEEYRSGLNRSRINDELYSGRLDVIVRNDFYQRVKPGGTLSVIDLVTELKSSDPQLAESFKLYPNQFVVLWRKQEWLDHQERLNNGEKSPALDVPVGCFDPTRGLLEILPAVEDLPHKIKPRNQGQRMQVYALFHPRIKQALITGQAGSGKTLLTMLAGVEQTDDSKNYPNRYKQMLLMRSLKTVGSEDIGALPGGEGQKTEPFMQGYLDNLQVIAEHSNTDSNSANKKDKHKSTGQTVTSLMSSGKIKIQIMGYIRGRSISHRFLVVDEVQNLDPGSLKTIVTRPAEGTKVVLMGDVGQIDDGFLNIYSNGLADLIRRHEIRWQKAIERDELATNTLLHQTAIIRLDQGERSDLADFNTELYERLDDLD